MNHKMNIIEYTQGNIDLVYKIFRQLLSSGIKINDIMILCEDMICRNQINKEIKRLFFTHDNTTFW